MGDNLALALVVGCATGFIFAGLVGFVSSKILWHWKRVKAIRKPQIAVSTTEKTPWQVVVDGCASLFKLILFIFVVIFLLAAALVLGREKIIAFVRNIAQLQ
jgi:hypothetical protein